jgi:hypothetical protein
LDLRGSSAGAEPVVARDPSAFALVDKAGALRPEAGARAAGARGGAAVTTEEGALRSVGITRTGRVVWVAPVLHF